MGCRVVYLLGAILVSFGMFVAFIFIPIVTFVLIGALIEHILYRRYERSIRNSRDRRRPK